MRVIWNRSDIELCLRADGVQRAANWTDGWRVNRRRIRRQLLDHPTLQAPRYFCQNSGACGSTYLVQLLNDNGVPRCFHEKRPDFNELGVEHFDRPIEATRLRDLMRYTRWDVFFEANNRLFSLTQPLADAFPNSHFLHLFRDGRKAVASAMSKPGVEEYLTRNVRFQGTLAGQAGQSPLVRFCHYWNNMNRRILQDFDALGNRCGPVFYLSLTDLQQGRVDRLADFLKVRLPVRQRPVVNKGRVGTQGQYPRFEEWSAVDQRTFWDICGATQSELLARHQQCHEDGPRTMERAA